MTRSRWILAMGLLALAPARAATAIELPETLGAQGRQVREAFAQHGYAYAEHGADPDALIRAVYGWLAAEISQTPPEALLQALAPIVPVATNEGDKRWDDRQRQIGPDDHRAAPLTASAVTWLAGDRWMLAFRIDYARIAQGRSGYLVSRPPVLLARDATGVVVGGNVGGTAAGELDAPYTFEGLVPGGDQAWPDLVQVIGPSGSGAAAYVEQWHPAATPPREWQRIWRVPFNGVTAVDYDGRRQRLSVSYFDGAEQHVRLVLTHGAPGRWE